MLLETWPITFFTLYLLVDLIIQEFNKIMPNETLDAVLFNLSYFLKIIH